MAADWVADVQHELRAFARERDWEKYHTPRNLAALIASEAGELLALFRWDQDSVRDRPADVRHEVADVLLGILRFAAVAEIDLETAAREKLALNRMRYPPNATGGPDRPDTTSHNPPE